MNTKLFVRPKVRFCQTDTDESMKKETENSIDPKCESRPSGKPRIKSIVTLSKPVKLVKSNETVGIYQITDSRLIDNAQNIYSLSSNAQTHPSLSTQTSSSLDVNTSRAEKLPSLNDANNTQNIKANSKQVDTQSSPIKPSDYDTIVPVASLQRSEDLNKTNKPNHDTKSNSSKKDSMKVKKGNEKENAARNAKKVVKTTAIKSSVLSASKTKAKLCSAGTSVKPPKIRNRPSIPNGSKRDLHSKPIAVGVMPCHKHNKVASKVKIPYVKKTVIRDIVGPKIKSCIEPGVSHRKTDIVKLPETDETLRTKPIFSGDKLARPEYNSIMCTISKLNEMKKEKAVHDIEHLSPAYKSLINEKVVKSKTKRFINITEYMFLSLVFVLDFYFFELFS